MSHLLPILWAQEPTSADWAALSAARESLGITELIKPARAVPGSPGRILAVGTMPTWLCPNRQIPDTSDPGVVRDALQWCLEPDEGLSGEDIATTLSTWTGLEITYKGDEEYAEVQV